MTGSGKYFNKVVWLTGASSGIGEQLAYKLYACGAKLILSARNVQKLTEVAGKCNFKNAPFILPVDLSDQSSLSGKCREAVERYGHIDFLFNIAGVAHRDYALNTEMKTDRKIMQVNYFGTIEISKFVLKEMLKKGYGHIVVTSSLSGKYGVPLLSAYSASKHALHGFFESLRAEVFKQNIKITIIIPGFIKTPITRNALKGDGRPFGEMLKVQEKGYSASECAEKILEAVGNEKEEIFIGGPERFTLILNRIFPGYFTKFIRSHPLKKLRRFKNYFLLKRKDDI